MTLCLGIVEDGLGRPVLYKNYFNTDNPFVLERCEIYSGGTVLNTGVLYLARADMLPAEISVQEGAALISIGMPGPVYAKLPLRLLVFDDALSLADLSNETSRIFFEYNTLEQKLQDCINKGRSVQHMVELVAPYLNGNELLVCTDDYRIIGKSNETVHLNEISGMSQPNADGTLPAEVVTFFKNDIIFNQIRTLKEPFIYDRSIFICRAICMNIFRHSEYACRVILAEDVNTFRGYEEGLVRFFTSFIQLVYDLSAEKSDILSRDHMADMFIDLLGGDSVMPQRMENRLTQRGWQVGGPFLCLRILPSERDYYTRTIPYYCQVFNRDFPGSCFFEYDDVIVGVTDLNCYEASAENFITAYLETFRDGDFRVGFSNVFTDMADLRSSYVQAEVALKTGQKHFQSQWFFRFSDVSLLYMEAKLTEELDGRFLCAPEILTLYQYDQVNGSNYLQTLKGYLDNQMNAVKTAKELYIHRATMVYRLERIRELTGIDFKDSNKLLQLIISTNLLVKDLLAGRSAPE